LVVRRKGKREKQQGVRENKEQKQIAKQQILDRDGSPADALTQPLAGRTWKITWSTSHKKKQATVGEDLSQKSAWQQ